MTLPDAVREAVEGVAGSVTGAARVGGGSVGEAWRVATTGGAVFVKWAAGEAGRSFAAEAEGLAMLAAAAPPDLVLPPVLRAASAHGSMPGLIVLPWLEPGRPDGLAWARFGRALAHLHAAPPAVPRLDTPYGRAADHWIGSKPQAGGWGADWPTFFGERRLRAQAATVRARAAWDARWDAPLDRLVARLPRLLPASPPPATLHGDLWAGNALALADGRFALIDPAAYVGHAEADLAMTRLFGGFDRAFYAGYADVAPPAPGADERAAVYNLFHLINHLTHGAGYASAVEATLRRFA